MILTQEHQQRIEQIREKMETEKLGRHTTTSHMIRSVGKPITSLSPYIKELQKILLYDPNSRTVWVEGGMTVEQLVRFTLARGVVPPVVPEFKHITVGGAVTGTALESSSFRYGQFNDPCLAFEVLSPDGTVRYASHKENRDLFHALPGSYGTLGGITAVQIPLLPAKDWVSLQCQVVSSMEEALNLFQERANEEIEWEYLDAVALSSNKIVVMSGRQVLQKHLSQESQKICFSYPWSSWWITHIASQSQKKSRWSCHFSLYDYLFRFDRGAFWMGQFITPRTLLRFLFEYGLKNRQASQSLHQAFQKTLPSLDPKPFLRFLTGWKLSSQQLYRLLHSMSEKALRETFFVHDFYLPWKNVSAFVEFVENKIDLFPLWLCPIKGSQTQFLSPHYTPSSSATYPDFVNVGVYGIPRCKNKEIMDLTREAEQKVRELGGRKMLYSANTYRKEEFWSVYDQTRYLALREKYGCSSYPDLFQKI